MPKCQTAASGSGMRRAIFVTAVGAAPYVFWAFVAGVLLWAAAASLKDPNPENAPPKTDGRAAHDARPRNRPRSVTRPPRATQRNRASSP